MIRLLTIATLLIAGCCDELPDIEPDAGPAQFCNQFGECRADASPRPDGAALDAGPPSDADTRVACVLPHYPCPDEMCCEGNMCKAYPGEPGRCPSGAGPADAGLPAPDASPPTPRACDCEHPCQNGLCCEQGFCYVPPSDPLRCVYDDATLVPDAGVCE